MSENQNFQLHAYIRGRVQGVSFRYYTFQTAQNLHLTGWVRNLWDGRVEILAEGELDNLNSFLRWLRKGPSSAVVRDVDYKFTDASGKFNEFRVRPNG